MTVTVFIDELFPRAMALNAQRREKEDGLQINRMANGKEKRNQRYSQALFEYEVGFPPQGYEAATITAVKNLGRASRWGAIPFRFRDFDPSMSVLDMEVIGVGNGADQVFQCKKSWTAGGTTSSRTVTRPVTGLQVYVNGVLKTVVTHYTIDYNTGTIVFDTAPPDGHEVAVNGLFDILVRFNKEYEAEGLTHALENSTPFTLIEVNDLA